MLKAKMEQENTPMEKRRIRISSKRQITIPVKYYEALGLSKELDCIYSNGMLILRPVQRQDPAFAEEILADLIKQGYTGEKLLVEFKRTSRQIRPAIEKIIKQADAIAEIASEQYKDLTDDILGTTESED